MANTNAMDGDEQSMFQCGLCKHNFKRMEHLARHVRSHTQSRPHKCHICPKAFTRTDLLRRHVAGHDAEINTPNEGAPGSHRGLPSRVTQACRACASHHLRCSEEKPCRRCTKRGIRCIWSNPIGQDNIASSIDSDPAEESPDAQSADLASTNSLALPVLPLVAQDIGWPNLGITDPQPYLDSSLKFDAGQFAFAFPDPNLLSGSWSHQGLMDLDIDTSMDIDDMDLEFLNNYNANIPFKFDNISQPERSVSYSQPSPRNTEAFQTLYWRFRPNKKDHHGSEDQYLSIPSSDQTSPESRVYLEKRVTCSELGMAVRDKILAMVVTCCRPENSFRATASFPSVKLLDTLLQYYLTSPVTGAASFLHLAAFNPNTSRPELVAIMAAAGAALTSDPTLTKLGYAIQECVRVAIVKLWEEDNTMVRDLQISQAFLITLEIGLWSGHNRKVEIAEGLLQPILTMFRRNGKFKRSAYSETVISDDLQGAALERTWLAWVDSESYKRLAFRLLLHDASCSMALLANPLISYAEFSAPLPLSEEIWSSDSPEHWKATCLSRTNGRMFTVADFLTDPETLTIHRGNIDLAAASFAMLSCSWSLCWEFIQLNSLQRSRKHQWNALVMSSRHEELSRLVKNLRIFASHHLPQSTSVIMRLELVLLHLNMQFEDIQIFAGLEGPEQARSAYPFICEWAQSESARRSVYHAAQIIRTAREIPRGSIDAITAIILYHASLAFLVYGLLAKSKVDAWGGSLGSSMPPDSADDVFLDQPEDFTIRTFFQHGRGSPCFQFPTELGTASNSPGTIYLTDIKSTMRVVVDILQANYDNQLKPRLIDKLIQLMISLEGTLRGGSC
ncbi:hypothetical protein B0J13DRAFT_502011 [Dactylonectria estremocensis]|uniref:Uncharacterized protein n=1 Tax=Dactylonectria estremocensis TaxID=1079267 RepID=A0A9P9ET49_9HYPO|nr:hypothetical protein B0J13DRAFT_502011 [Dactylonectria estremocensis]